MFEGKDVKVLLAVAGSGKTSTLVKYIEEELKTRRPEEIAFVTFTKKGADEGLRRVCDKFCLTPEDLPYFRTLHSLTFHALNLKVNQVFSALDQKEFNKTYGYYVNRVEVNKGKAHPTKDSLYLDYYDLERSNALTSKQIAESDIDVGYYRSLVRKYEDFKASKCAVDFFDCLIKYVQEGDSLPCKVVMIDECFSPDTKVRMADMSIKEIKDIKIGEYVMGTGSKPVKVTAIHKGTDIMYDVLSGKKKKLFTCNSQHLLAQHYGKNLNKTRWEHSENISRHGFVQFNSVALEHKNLLVDPYFFGLWLGNGFSREAVVVCNENDLPTVNWLKEYGEKNGDKVILRHREGVVQVEYSVKEKHRALKCSVRKQLESYGYLLSKTKDNTDREYKEKRIPSDLLNGSLKQRLALLAGIIDSDGMYVKSGNTRKYRIEMARKELMQDIFNLVSSLGFNPTWYVTHHTTNKIKREYYRVDFFGSSDIPCLLPRKQFTGEVKEEYSCRVVEKGIGNYIGITVEAEDHLFLLANGAVVHNCQDITALQWKVIEKAFKNAEKVYVAGDDKQSIYTYSGARPDILINLSKQYPVEHLTKSYRIPLSVYRLANAITEFIGEKTEQKSEPRIENGEGSITQLSDTDRLAKIITPVLENKNESSWFILARNKCFLNRATESLEDNLIPYWTVDGFFMGGEVMKRLTDYESFKLEGYKSEEKRQQFAQKFGITDFSVPFTSTNLFTEGRKWVYASYIEKYGLDFLKEMCKWKPQILVSTIHAQKGAEADNVAVLLDATRKTKRNVFEDIDEELRCLYVAVTRTKKNLYFIDSQDSKGYDDVITTLKNQFCLDF